MIRRRLRPSEAGALVLTAALLAGCGGGGGKGEGDAGERVSADPDPPARAAEAPARGAPASTPAPSDFARRTIRRPLLRLYLQSGREIGVGWWVIAAVDQIDLEAGDPRIPPGERIPGIGYSLAAAGAPHDDRAALVARAGSAYADRVLALSRKLVKPPQTP